MLLRAVRGNGVFARVFVHTESVPQQLAKQHSAVEFDAISGASRSQHHAMSGFMPRLHGSVLPEGITAATVHITCLSVAAVGDDIFTAGVSGIFFGAFGQAGVNALAITMGTNARAISAVCSAPESSKALAALHAVFLRQSHYC